MQFFDSKVEARKLEEKIIGHLAKHPITKKLLIVQIGNNASSEKYIKLKLALCAKLNIPAHYELIPHELSDSEIVTKIKLLFSDPMVGGGIIQMPFPRKSLQKTLKFIPANKDIDNLLGLKDAQFEAPVVRALQHFLAAGKIKTGNLPVSVIGYGELVGMPISDFLLQQGAEVTILDESTNKMYKNGQKLECGLLILSAGVPKLVKGEDIKARCAVVDFGSSVVDGKIVGDLDLDSDLEHLGLVAKSPGGLGPLVVRYLVMNFLGI